MHTEHIGEEIFLAYSPMLCPWPGKVSYEKAARSLHRCCEEGEEGERHTDGTHVIKLPGKVCHLFLPLPYLIVPSYTSTSITNQ